MVTETLNYEGELTGDYFVEQATYHEWLNSDYEVENKTCQECHMPALEKGLFNIAAGYAKREDELYNNLDTAFGIASGTKGFTALGVLRLIDLGKLSLEDQVFELLPYEFPNMDKNITVELLIPDLQYDEKALYAVANCGAEVVGHNMETVPRLYSVRKGANYKKSLHVLKTLKESNPRLNNGSLLVPLNHDRPRSRLSYSCENRSA